MKSKQQQTLNAAVIGSVAGHIGGLLYAFSKKKKFCGYVGHFFLWGIVGGSVAWLAAQAIIPGDE